MVDCYLQASLANLYDGFQAAVNSIGKFQKQILPKSENKADKNVWNTVKGKYVWGESAE